MLPHWAVPDTDTPSLKESPASHTQEGDDLLKRLKIGNISYIIELKQKKKNIYLFVVFGDQNTFSRTCKSTAAGLNLVYRFKPLSGGRFFGWLPLNVARPVLCFIEHKHVLVCCTALVLFSAQAAGKIRLATTASPPRNLSANPSHGRMQPVVGHFGSRLTRNEVMISAGRTPSRDRLNEATV